MDTNTNTILGSWLSDPSALGPGQVYEKIRLDFTDNGRLVYTIIEGNKEQMVLLTYKIEKDILVTDQPSNPKEQRTNFSFTPDGKLVLQHQGVTQVFTPLVEANH